ncbi:hypothetical protein CAEBREN_05672 [Caenorhabditis brenneri]|uniref:Uncharacterized protein n=1 Tax=Caenorhabditis brenneri TaxID=135651 RepID=G0MUP4_CAEBE|nr:hypothetical protein CAEBREN_05672 [Caenorhabditis brenneri]
MDKKECCGTEYLDGNPKEKEKHLALAKSKLEGNPMKIMELRLRDETEEYQKYREQFEEIRKEQARRARWGHVLVNEDCITHERFRDIDGTIREFNGVRCRDDWAWEAPLDFKELDLLSDDEILKMRMGKKQNIAEMKKRENEEVEEEAERDFEKWKEEARKKKEEEERIKKEEEEKKKEQEATAGTAKEKSKVKTVEKSKRPEDPPQKVPTPPKQKSTRSKVSVAPPKTDDPPIKRNQLRKKMRRRTRNLTRNRMRRKIRRRKIIYVVLSWTATIKFIPVIVVNLFRFPTEIVMDSKPDEPKSTKAAELPGPFLLEVTPEELVIPPTGNLEVKIRNPTDSKCKVYVYFDSFFWLMKINGKFVNINRGSANSMCFGSVLLWPEDRFTLSIGYHDAKYEDKERCYEYCPPFNCDTHCQRTVDVHPSKRNNYSYERPEGVLVIKYHLNVDTENCSEEVFNLGFHVGKSDKCDPKPDKCDPNKHPMKKMDLYLKDETEEYKKYREQFEEIRKEQERKARWGHVLVNEDGVTKEKFRDLDGTIREFGDRRESLSDWEYDIPTDLKQFDALSDEEILKIRKERKEKIEEKHRKEEEEAKKRAEESIKKVKEKWKKQKEEIKKKEEEEEMKKKKEKEEADAAAKEKSKVKTVEKSKRPEEPSQNVQKSTKSNVSAAPPKVDVTPTNKKPSGKPDAMKNKKKKANPCCSVM